jgi:hypothetical protein
MIFAKFDASGAPLAFWDDEISPPPDDAVEISAADRDMFVAAPQAWLWKDRARVTAPPRPKTATSDEIKSECARRISMVASGTAQNNMLADAVAGNFTSDDSTAWKSGVAWIASMRATCRALISAADPTYAEDLHWPACPVEAATLASRY